MTPRRIIVSGDRNWPCDALAARVVRSLAARHGAGWTLVHGGASGVDSAFHRAAEDAGVAAEVHVARWAEMGRAAGPRRNQEMVDAGADFLIAVHRSIAWSRGTRNCVDLAILADIPVYLIASDDDPGRRIRAIPEKEGARR